MAKKEKNGGFVTGHDKGIGLGEHSNMPKEVMMKDYPKVRLASDPGLDDTIDRLDDENDQGQGKRRRYISNQH